MPLSQRDGTSGDCSIAEGKSPCVEVTSSSSNKALHGQVQKQCRAVSVSRPHLGHVESKEGLMECILAAGQQPAASIVSIAHLSG